MCKKYNYFINSYIHIFFQGNIPSNKPELITILKEAIDRGVFIVNISQCYYSSVSPIYQTGTVLQKIGVVFGNLNNLY